VCIAESMRRATLSFGLACLALVACDNPNPGTPLGTFVVASTLSVDTCGGTVVDGSPGIFDVTISNDDGLIYWFPNTGGTGTYGVMDPSGTVSINEVVADDVDMTEAGASGACTLQRNDTLTFTLPSGAAPGSFTGSYSFTMSAASGANCADQLTANGGGYGALPCTVTYGMKGTRQ
jgi:hypothetical protein